MIKRTFLINYDYGKCNLNRTFVGTEKQLFAFISKMESKGYKNVTYYQFDSTVNNNTIG